MLHGTLAADSEAYPGGAWHPFCTSYRPLCSQRWSAVGAARATVLPEWQATQVVDMFGCGLPVCAVSYPCIGELVEEGQTGLLFTSAQQLAQQLVSLLQACLLWGGTFRPCCIACLTAVHSSSVHG